MILPAGAHGPERIVALHEIEVTPNVDLLRNRVGLRRLVARNIDEVTAHAVLAFFVQPGETAYRLTYAARESVMNTTTLAVERQETAARRFTYILGPGDARRTAALRLAGLANDRQRATASLESLTAAFAVESLNTEFFDYYRAHYEAFRDYLLGTDAPVRLFGIPAADVTHADPKHRDRALKPVRDFVKKLLGRIVFLHFLQKKGWLGCPATSTDWTHGDPVFLDNLFRQTPTADRFHSERLVPLFYDTLNRPDRTGDLFPVTGTRVPYLNGGLFERDFPGVDQVDFPGELFAALFEFLGGYHFTIDENDPEDHEIGIDPEMLGHIFENLLEDNKDKGAYYTPKAVVHYMARQSLVHALVARFPGDAAAPAEIATFLRVKEPVDPRTESWLSRHATELARHLDDLRICDPAIGSGAFPIGLLHEIYWAKLALNPALPRAAAKRAIIQNSIHGVDLDAGAVEIARLRFWLALVVDETAPSPLPNLDYQIMQGNSLLESFEGERLDNLAESPRYGVRRLGTDQNEFDLGGGTPEFVEVATAPHVDLGNLRSDYFRCHDPVAKARLRAQIDAAVLRAIDARLARRVDELEISLQTEASFVGRRARSAKETKARAAMEAELTALRSKTARLHALLADPRAERPFFLWHLWFRHVLAEAPEGRGGFDIVIANPPYVDVKRLPAEEVETFFRIFQTTKNRINIYAVFIEFGYQLLRSTGVMAYINPNSLLVNESYSKVRRLILNDTTELLKLPDGIFKEVVVETMLLFVQSGSNAPTARVAHYGHDDEIDFDRINFSEAKKTDWIRDPEFRFQIFGTSADNSICEKLENAPLRFIDVAEFCLGLTPYDKYKGHSTELIKERRYHASRKISDVYVPLIDGANITRYSVSNEVGEWIKYGPWLGAPRERRFFTSPRIIVRQILSGKPPRIYAGYTEEPLFHAQIGFALVERNGAEVPIKVLLALLNSRLFEFYHRHRFLDKEKVVFQKVLIANVKTFPLVRMDKTQIAELTTKVDAILAATRAGDAARVATLEAEIDAIVYRLYGLTAPEIALIEGRA